MDLSTRESKKGVLIPLPFRKPTSAQPTSSMTKITTFGFLGFGLYAEQGVKNSPRMKEITLKGMLDAWSRFPEISGFCPCSRKRAYVENATTAMNAARCITTGCANFGSANNGGKCNKCTGYKRTVVDAYVAPVPHVEAAPPAVKSTPTPTEMHHPGELEWYSPCYDRYVDTRIDF